MFFLTELVPTLWSTLQNTIEQAFLAGLSLWEILSVVDHISTKDPWGEIVALICFHISASFHFYLTVLLSKLM